LAGQLALLFFFLFLTLFVIWVAWQIRKNVCNVLRLLPVAWFAWFLLSNQSIDAWQQNGFLVLFFATVVEGEGVMLTPTWKWFEEKCDDLQPADIIPFALFVMVLATLLTLFALERSSLALHLTLLFPLSIWPGKNTSTFIHCHQDHQLWDTAQRGGATYLRGHPLTGKSRAQDSAALTQQ
jgi:hypothetical protein